MEDKQQILNSLCETLLLTRNAGGDGNHLLCIKYVQKDNGDEVARPIFRNGAGSTGYYDVNISGDSGTAIIMDVVNQFVKRMW